jgi:hypothetical protein
MSEMRVVLDFNSSALPFIAVAERQFQDKVVQVNGIDETLESSSIRVLRNASMLQAEHNGITTSRLHVWSMELASVGCGLALEDMPCISSNHLALIAA